MANLSVVHLNWFCGDNSSDYDQLSICKADALSVCVHGVFLILASVVLAVLGCCTSVRSYHSSSIIHFPGHYCKWILSMLLWLVLLCAVGEGIITDLSRNTVTQPHQYIPQTLAITNGIMCLVYYHHMEYWNKPGMSWLLFLYWMSSITTESLRLVVLIEQIGFDINILRFGIIMVSIALYGLCLVIEINVIRTKVFGCLYHDKPYPRDLKKKNMHYVHAYTNMLSQIVYWSLNWLFAMGFRRPLEISDLGCLPEEFESRYQYKNFQRAYRKEKERTDAKNTKASLWRTYRATYGCAILIGSVLAYLSATFGFIPALAIGWTVSYATDYYYGFIQVYDTPLVTVTEFFNNGFVLLGVIFITIILQRFSYNFGAYIATMKSIQVRSALQSFTYEKSLHLSSWSLSSGQMTVGQIANHMSVDAIAVQTFTMLTTSIVSIPYQIVVIIILLYFQLGVAALIGCTLFVVATPVQYKVIKHMSKEQRRVMGFSDERLKKSNELLQGMKLLKLQGWEEMFCSAIEVVRAKEISQLLKVSAHTICTTLLAQATPVIVTFISFAVYSKISETPLTPDIVFASLALYTQLANQPLLMVPPAVSALVNALVSTKRLQHFFAASELAELQNGRPASSRGFNCVQEDYHGDGNRGDDEIDDIEDEHHELNSKDTDRLIPDRKDHRYGTFNNDEENSFVNTVTSSTNVPDIPDDIAVKITDCNCTWDIDVPIPTLSDINVDILAGELTMVVGIVGSGKSSLLSAILGEMTIISGSIYFNRNRSSICYVPQKPWLQNATLKENVIFGKDFELTRYQTVIEACALQPDIDILPAGDMTEIGEKGINLSGGQKQRVSVARALYSKADIVLLDDPLSALDVHVGSHLLEQGIADFLKKENRTVVLVTHQIQYLDYANKVVVMDNGRICSQGDLQEIQKQDPSGYSDLKKKIELSASEIDSESDEDKTLEMQRQSLIKQVKNIEKEEKKMKNAETGTLIKREERERGSVSWRVYLAYGKAMKLPLVFLMLVMFLVQGTIHIFTNFWLSQWSEAGMDTENKTQEELDDELDYNLRGYAAWSFSYVLIAIIATTCQIIFFIFAAKRLHISLLRNIVHAPMRFFDTTPIGRVLNRLSNDTQIIDQRLWMTINTLMNCTLQSLTALVVNAIVTPIFLAVVAPALAAFFLVMKYFIATSRELKRLDSISASPVFAHFSETLGGLSTIRAYRDENRFKKIILERLNGNHLTQLYVHTSNKWLQCRLHFIGAVIVLISGLSSLLSLVLSGIEPSLVGLSLTYAFSMYGYMATLVMQLGEMEIQMNAVERVEYYTQVEGEEYRGTYTPPSDWPNEGDIKIENISVRYAEDLDPVLQDINIHFQGGQRIGICGRTGSGKSSLTLAMFRMIDTYKGYIHIDNVNIAHVPLLKLRSRLSIIPQDPVLFRGTIRYNMDPEGVRSDDELWEALEIAQLKTTVLDLNGQLDAQVSEEGDNFSVGQRQLFCLARAFLRNTRILIMDEATASIDMKTDSILKTVIQTAFPGTTVITVAHRITTIMDSDMVLVLSDGRVAEYDTPQNLLSKKDSMFSSLVKGTMS
ncbi:ATP-binding cassette sub-family C member 9-like [Glandiceps talaboti]